MPRQQQGNSPGTAMTFVLPADIAADLLAAQRESIGTVQRLPQIKIMPAAAGRFEFKDTNDVVADFEGVILGSHSRNVLWPTPFGTERPRDSEGNEMNGPACSSNDGKYGVPQPGFRHAALDSAATGAERIDCSSCPYNQFNSKTLIGGNGKGKAVTNMRSVYVMLEGHEAPMELVISNTSIPLFDEYLTRLLTQRVPVQAVVTRFTQEIKTKPGSNIRWAVAQFATGAYLTQEAFDRILAKRTEFLGHIQPSNPVATDDNIEDAEVESPAETSTSGNQDEMPF